MSMEDDRRRTSGAEDPSILLPAPLLTLNASELRTCCVSDVVVAVMPLADEEMPVKLIVRTLNRTCRPK